MSVKNLKDDLFVNDQLTSGKLWARTEVICGYGYHHSSDNRVLSYLDEVLFAKDNMVPISGVQTILQMAFGVPGPIEMRTLYSKFGIGLPDEPAVPQYLVPVNEDPEGGATMRNAIYQPGHLVQLFGLGITGTAENNITVQKVGYREVDIEGDIHTPDGVINGTMIPFRYTESELDPNEKQKYFGKKLDTSTGKIGYYLKRLESTPEIKHIWKSSDKSSAEIEATNDTIWDYSRDDAVKSLVEMHLVITEKDLKEWFNYKLDQPEAARFNCLALFDGRYSEVGKGEFSPYGDYTNVRLFSKLNIPTEHVSLEKDLEFIYRVYGS